MFFLLIILTVLCIINGLVPIPHPGVPMIRCKASKRPQGAEIFDRYNPVREVLTFLGSLWGETFAPIKVDVNKSKLRYQSKYIPTSIATLDGYKKTAKNFGSSEDVKEAFSKKWGVDHKTKSLIPPALA